MTVKITARFPDTESADFTLGRILQSIKNIYESRVYFDSEYDGAGIANNILYYAKSGDMPYRISDSVSSSFELDRTDKLMEECLVGIVCESSDAEDIRSTIYNGGGFDVDVFEV